MCTSIAFRQKGLFFGRNMDLDYNFGERIVATPRGFLLRSLEDQEHLGFIGTATVVDGYPLYADAMNEKGLCVAGLNFPGKAFYRQTDHTKTNIPAFDFIAYVAAKFSSVEDLTKDFEKINITDRAFSEKIPCPTLHWMVSDNTASVVIESSTTGINLYKNPLDVMTNLPEFQEQLENYKKMKSEEGSAPSDFPVMLSSSSRFLRMAHFLGNIFTKTDPDSIISHVFHLLDTVAMPDASVKMQNGNYHKTTYSMCLDTLNKRYFVRTYENSRISCVQLNEKMLSTTDLSIFTIPQTQDYLTLN